MKKFSLFLKDPLWIYLLGISGLTFYLVDSYGGYLLASILLVFSLASIHFFYLGENLKLHEKITRQLEKFGSEFTIYPAMEVSDGKMKGTSDFLIVSPKGIFNIHVLDFEGTIFGHENDEFWEYIKIVNAYEVKKSVIKNPLRLHRRTHRIIENLLEDNLIKYIPIQSIFVINNTDANFESDANINFVKVNGLYQYINEYQDRSNIPPILQEILQVFSQSGYNRLLKHD